MSKKIAILRGINVGGRRKILMADLRSLFEKLGFQEAQTYIQSGNVLFHTDSSTSNIEIATKLEQAITKQYDFDVPVIVIDANQLKKLANKNPFYKNEKIDITHLHLTFLKEPPSKENRLKTEKYNYEPDQFVVNNQGVFVYCEDKYHQSKLTNTFFEKKLKVAATTRNWKTVMKLMELCSAKNQKS